MSDRNQLPQFDLMDAMEEAVCFLNPENVVIFTNSQAEKVLKAPSSQILERNFLDFFADESKGLIESALIRSKVEGRVRLNTCMSSLDDGREVPVLLRVVQYQDQDANHRGAYAIFLDLTDLNKALREQESLKERNRELEHLVVTCPLTGIYNRRYFELRFAEEVARAKRYRHGMCLGLVDIDHFKKINDTFGHQAGDMALKRFARILRDSVRSTDIVSRYGGEEFAIVFPEAHPEEIMPVCIRMRQKIQRTPINTPKGEIRLTASFGICPYPLDDPEITRADLVSRADESLYRAKEEGRNRIVLYGHPVEA
ncbi:MAG: sensor domain-containing diguanylate cyclase [Candidatus Omnitrophica bacterium]|nr:sensor domain-containing diguanylate cyclase [Candidatus Omnitrophota bacterium]